MPERKEFHKGVTNPCRITAKKKGECRRSEPLQCTSHSSKFSILSQVRGYRRERGREMGQTEKGLERSVKIECIRGGRSRLERLR